jgi:hypothetical protein
MDDDEEERDFSKSIVYDFFVQAKDTLQQMDQSLSVNLMQPNPFHYTGVVY